MSSLTDGKSKVKRVYLIGVKPGPPFYRPTILCVVVWKAAQAEGPRSTQQLAMDSWLADQQIGLPIPAGWGVAT